MGSPLAPVLFIYGGIRENYGQKLFRTQRYNFTDVMFIIHSVYFIRRIKRYYFSTILTLGPLTSDSLWKKKQITTDTFQMINNDTHLPVASVYYRNKTFTGPLTNDLKFKLHSFLHSFLPSFTHSLIHSFIHSHACRQSLQEKHQ